MSSGRLLLTGLLCLLLAACASDGPAPGPAPDSGESALPWNFPNYEPGNFGGPLAR